MKAYIKLTLIDGYYFFEDRVVFNKGAKEGDEFEDAEFELYCTDANTLVHLNNFNERCVEVDVLDRRSEFTQVVVTYHVKFIRDVTHALWLLTLKNDPNRIKEIPIELLTHDMVVMAVRKDGSVIRWLPSILVCDYLIELAEKTCPNARELMQKNPLLS